MNELYLWRAGVHVATARPGPDRSLDFTWTGQVPARHHPREPLVSLNLDPRGNPLLWPRAAAAYLEGLLPERGSGLRERLAEDAGTDVADVTTLLGTFGLDTTGALQFTQGEEPREGHLEAISPQEINLRLRRARGDLPPDPDATDYSLPGVQPKVVLHRHEGTWYLPRAGAPSTHILKPLTQGREDLGYEEAWCSHLAQALDLGGAGSEVVDFGGVLTLVVPRYDRVGSGPNLRRLHQEDGAQLLGLPGTSMTHKFEWGNQGASLANLAKALRRGNLDLKPLARLTLLNVAVRNVDAHAKNISVLYQGNTSGISPTYDVAPHQGDKLSLYIHGKVAPEAITADDLSAEFAAWGIPSKVSSKLVREGLESLHERVTSPQNGEDRGVRDYTRSKVLERLEGFLEQSVTPGSGGGLAVPRVVHKPTPVVRALCGKALTTGLLCQLSRGHAGQHRSKSRRKNG